MKVFISWSGNKSHKVAMIFREWLPSVIQSLEPYVSSEDIDKGARWSSDIAKELEDSTFGILCVTKDNLHAPWLSFEAGALSKTMDKSFVTPFLFDIKRSASESRARQRFLSQSQGLLPGLRQRACLLRACRAGNPPQPDVPDSESFPLTVHEFFLLYP